MELNLRGKAVLVTGASKGIGRGCAELFAAEGASVHLTARSRDLLEAAFAEIRDDVTDEATMLERMGHTVNVFPGDYGNVKVTTPQDLAVAVAQTDVKGDRGKPPSQQTHPDYYVRIVDERPDGIVVRGAKIHTSVMTNSNEVIVLPTRNMSEADRDYAVAFAIPVDTPGLKMICSPYGAPRHGNFDHPITSQHKMTETLTVFDDVFVPRERVFLQKEWQYAGALAKTFVEFHRFTAISYKLPLTDTLAGAAQLIADYNGLLRAGHIREKITRLIAYTQTLRALTTQAALACRVAEEGIAVPSPLLVNIAKLHFAENYHDMIGALQDISGGILVTAPGEEDLLNPETRPLIEKYLGGREGVSAADRLRALNMISELTAADFGGYQAVLAIHAEGSIEAEKMTIHREYDFRDSLKLAKYVAGLDT